MEKEIMANRKSRRGPIVHASWKPIFPKSRFMKRRRVRWIERTKSKARRMLCDFRTPPNSRGRARAFLTDLRDATSHNERVRSANHFQWFLMGVGALLRAAGALP